MQALMFGIYGKTRLLREARTYDWVTYGLILANVALSSVIGMPDVTNAFTRLFGRIPPNPGVWLP